MDMNDIEGMITFTYYHDLAAAERFYGEVMGLEKVVDVEFAKVYKAAENAHMGIVDSAEGHLKASEEKPVMLHSSWTTSRHGTATSRRTTWRSPSPPRRPPT